MKKAIVFILYVIMVAFVFSGCNLFVQDKDAFDLNDTVTIAIGEKIYENERLWVRLDKITHDSRCPENVMCFIAGHVEGQFTVGGWGAQETLDFHTDSARSLAFLVPFDGVGGGNFYILNVMGISPERPNFETPIPKWQYRVDFVLEAGAIAMKPNIYLYPKFQTKMDVSLTFPQGGCITESDPEYPYEWNNIKVKPSGKINNEYEYLFYEAALPDAWQYDEGWSVMINDLETFFRQNLAEYGFNENEINDFINYWIPRLQDSPYYNIYPQYTEKVGELVTLNISKEPGSLLRLFYVIKGSPLMKPTDIPAPVIPNFERNGFTVTEWGVIL